ncbi:hypothetical protein AB3X94_03360 [Paraburkholderia sp. BR10923]|uniref:hypothetical protein n=1 Tax=Paraburkholderia sp. BR10923 TaxID=3236992 RepID=UPI0034CF0B25
MHGDAPKRMKCRDVSSLITQSTADLTYVKAAFRVISGGVASCCGKRTEAA